ncbi:glycosyltransferase [Paenibacillus sp. FSL R5-0407]|uniref:glycosyltransferase n=1 Tax=Paenibacillus sp. FSL R5-0407 TaxID=2975320 RepID=UPI0030F6C6BA
MGGIRVLMVMDSMDYGGTETHVLSIAGIMKEAGTHIVITGEGGPLTKQFERQFVTKLTHRAFPGTEAFEQSVAEMADLMVEENIQVVHLHQTPSGLIAALAAERLGIPVVFTVHGMYYPRNELQDVLSRTTAIISVSKPVQSYLQRMDIDSLLIPNGVDINLFSPSESAARELRNKLGISEDATVLLYASRLAWGKASVCSNFLSASKHLRSSGFPSLEVVVVGGGLQYGELERLKERIHLEAGNSFIHMVGNQDNMPDYYRMSDCVVGTGRVALEAMACAKPVLAAGNAGYLGWVGPDCYDTAWNLYFGDHGSLRAANRLVLIEALRKGISNKDSLMYLGGKGRDWVVKDFNAEKTALSTLQVYRQLLDEKSTRNRRGKE